MSKWLAGTIAVVICIAIVVANCDWNREDDIIRNIRTTDGLKMVSDIRRLAESEDYQYYAATNIFGYIVLYKYPKRGLLLREGTYVESVPLSVSESKFIHSQAIIEDDDNKVFAVFYPRSMF